VKRVACRAARLIGDGLYGVDVKELESGPVVIEVNDNPDVNLDYEDQAEGDRVYEELSAWFLKRIEQDPAPRRAEPPVCGEPRPGRESATFPPAPQPVFARPRAGGAPPSVSPCRAAAGKRRENLPECCFSGLFPSQGAFRQGLCSGHPACAMANSARAAAASVRAADSGARGQMAEGNALQGVKVMVIDDSNTIRRSAEIFLLQAGCTVILAEDGFDALAKIADHQPDLVFVDIMMPRLDGYQTCALIKKNSRFHAMPVVMLSSKDGLFDRARGRMVGSDQYLTKPFTKESLLKAVAAHVKSIAA
jgi:twitching motility two-component system response regulator PilG